MKSIIQFFKKNKIFFASFLLLFFSYSLNYFGLIETKELAEFSKGSEALVVNRINCTIENGRDFGAGLLMLPAKDLSGPCTSSNTRTYRSQFGLQGRIFGFFAPESFSQIDRYVDLLKVSVGLLFIISLSLFLRQITKEFGNKVALGTLILISISLWPAYYASNLYWMIFISYTPFIFGWLFYPYFKRTNQIFAFASLIGLLVLVKSLMGYEFISNIIASAALPVLYYELKDRVSWRQLFKPMLFVLIAGVLGFSVAIGTHLIALKDHYNSGRMAINLLVNRASERTFADTSNYPSRTIEGMRSYAPAFYISINRIINLDAYNDTEVEKMLHYPWVMYKYLHMQIIQPPVVLDNFLKYFQSLIGITVIIFAIIIKKRKSLFDINDPDRPLLWLVIGGIVASSTWAIMAPGHMMHHFHLAPIVFYLPYIFIAYILLSLVVTRFINRMR